jgi:hypothetical protein
MGLSVAILIAAICLFSIRIDSLIVQTLNLHFVTIFKYLFALVILSGVVIDGKCQNPDLTDALEKYKTVDIYAGKTVSIKGKNHLAIPVKLASDSSVDFWILYNATAKKTLIKDTFAFIFDYLITDTFSAILCKTKGKDQQIEYQTWAGYPEAGPPVSTIKINFLHQNKFTNNYIGITETGNAKPIYLNTNGQRFAMPGIPDSTFLYPFHNDTFQITQLPSRELLLLLKSQNYNTYSSISIEPNDVLLVKKSNAYWYLRFNAGRVDSIGPFKKAAHFSANQSYGIAQDPGGSYGIVSLARFQFYTIGWQPGEQISDLIQLKDTNIIACKYQSPKQIWRLFKWNGATLDTLVKFLPLKNDQSILPLYKAAVLLSNPAAGTVILPNISRPATPGPVLDEIIDSSLKVHYHYFQLSVQGKQKIRRVISVVSAATKSDTSIRMLYFIENGKMLTMKDSVSALSHLNERFIVYKRTGGWHWKDFETAGLDPPKSYVFKWITPFISMDKNHTQYIAAVLIRGKAGLPDIFGYIDQNSNLLRPIQEK